ncbi:MAG TPA: BTAD domain-containing putative transcriptional regulator, partial [Acidimicrobiales bacterium]|nr:BTAD domain-containing putative transcriptional regulator [Acidimicrobiales bacterium]
MQVALLGELRVRTGDDLVALSAPKERAVLEMLALRAGLPVPVELLSEGLWGQGEPPSAAKVLQTYISHLRRALPPGSVVTTTSGYALALDGEGIDARRFELAVAEARQLQEAGEHRRAGDVLREALALWRSRPCPELVEHSWATAEVARLEELRRVAQDELADARLAMGEHALLAGELEAAVAEEPFRE